MNSDIKATSERCAPLPTRKEVAPRAFKRLDARGRCLFTSQKEIVMSRILDAMKQRVVDVKAESTLDPDTFSPSELSEIVIKKRRRVRQRRSARGARKKL